MARVNFSDIDHYGGQGGGGYFSLKNDGDIARVRFMYESEEDVIAHAVHEVQIGDKKRYVNCLRTYEEPLDNCPFCKAQKKQVVKLFIPIYNIDNDRAEVWDRGKSYFKRIMSTMARYAQGRPLCSNVFEIERNGKANDVHTEYAWYQVESDNTTLSDLPELPNIDGGLVLDKTPEDMEAYLKTGVFPDDGDTNNDVPIRRRESTDRTSDRATSYDNNTRRTPNRRESF